jgi:hypothetical protein
MIFDLLIATVSTIFAFIGAFLPDASNFSTDITNSVSQLGGYFFVFDQLIAIDDLFIAISILVALEITLAGVNLARWIIRSIPFLNSRV